MKSWLVGALAAVCLTCASHAETCTKQLQIISRIPVATSSDLRRIYVPVEINGQPKRMILDTGADFSMLSAKTAKDLGLKVHDAPVRVYDVTGKASEHMTEAEFKLGKINFGHAEIMVSDRLDDLDEPDVAGLLGANMLMLFDVSLDVPGRTLDLLSQDHCPDQVIYWKAAAHARIPFQNLSVGRVVISARLDGKPVTAHLDTGAPDSTLYLKTAQLDYGIIPGSDDAAAAGTLNGDKNIPTYSHVFKTLEFDGVAVTNPKFLLISDRLAEVLTYVPTGSRLGYTEEAIKAPMLLGMNVLRHLHIYIAYKDRVLYLTPSDETPAAQESKQAAKPN